jgi:hypothetical protein
MARTNISAGPTSQFWISESASTFVFLNTSVSSSYFTFASGGYIIRIRPIAIGIFVVPLWKEFQKTTMPGKRYPETTPKNIARNIQSVRYRSINESFFFIDYPYSKYSIATYFFRTSAGRFCISENTLDDPGGTSYTSPDRNGILRTIHRTGAAFHTEITTNDFCLLVYHIKNCMWTDFNAHTASITLIGIQF